jgi:hypothetical protein
MAGVAERRYLADVSANINTPSLQYQCRRGQWQGRVSGREGRRVVCHDVDGSNDRE